MKVIGFMFILVGMSLFALYLYHVLKRMLQSFTHEKEIVIKRISLFMAILLVLPLLHMQSIWTIFLLHFIITSMLVDAIHFLVKRLCKLKVSKIWTRMVNLCVIPFIVCIWATSYGSYNMQHVIQTSYVIETDKAIREEGYRIAFFSDLHYGNAMSVEQLKTVCKEITSQNVDMIVLGGDIVDEGTSLMQLQEAISTLGTMKSNYGTFFVYGNHDLSKYSSDPSYSEVDLENALRQANIHILGEETYPIRDDFNIVARLDYSLLEDKYRDLNKEQAVLKNIDEHDFFLLLDHQPKGLGFNDEVGYDLQLSGHTHGGQFFPVAQISMLTGLMELDYGYEKLNHLQVIVSSGISGWAFPIRTQAHSEYVIIDIK